MRLITLLNVTKNVMGKQIVFLIDGKRKNYACDLIRQAPAEYVCEIKERSRTLEQNCYQWPYLEGFSRQKKWPVNGEMVNLTAEEWKDVLTSAYEEEVKPRLAMGYGGGGMVMLGRRTRNYGKKKFSEWMEWLICAATLEGIKPVFKGGEKRWFDE